MYGGREKGIMTSRHSTWRSFLKQPWKRVAGWSPLDVKDQADGTEDKEQPAESVPGARGKGDGCQERGPSDPASRAPSGV